MITEIIEYKLNEGVDEEEFITETKKFYDYFKATFKGFIDLEFTKGEDAWLNTFLNKSWDRPNSQ